MPGQKILIIDDDAHLRDSLCEVLDLEGFSCLEAGNAKAGIESAKEDGYDSVELASLQEFVQNAIEDGSIAYGDVENA